MDDATDGLGIRPDGHDGVESGDYRNFAPAYLGDETGWIRPTATVTDGAPIAGLDVSATPSATVPAGERPVSVVSGGSR